jgi:cold shock protein
VGVNETPGEPVIEQARFEVPVGKVRFYDAEKGFGFLTKDEGGDVYVRANALPPGVTTLKAGQRVEFGVVEGRKGEQALSVHIVEPPPSLSKAHRKPPEQMTVIIEDLIKMLDGIGNGYRRGRHPDARTASKIATVLRAVADELEL